MAAHTIKAFDEELQDIGRDIGEMGALTARQIENAMTALTAHDATRAKAVIAADMDIDRLQRQIEEKAILAIARRQPMAVDLREIVAALRTVNGFERIGDYAKNIGKRVIATGSEPAPPAAVAGLQHMADLVLAALRQVIGAYRKRDATEALAVWRGDAAIDGANNALFAELLGYMRQDAGSIPACTHLLFCAKNIERMGDHITNIAETVYYMVHGVAVEGERPKGDEAVHG